MGINEIYDLLKKYREHQCTPEEEERILRWYEQFEEDAEDLPEIPKGKLDQLWYMIKRKIPAFSWNRRMIIFYRYAVAIVVLLISGAGVMYFRGTEEQPKLVRQDILPAKGVTLLRLSDGREIPLDKAAVIRDREGMVIKNDSSRVLDYSLASKQAEPLYNTISVPAGGEYQVLLSDGSMVRLNSCSSLTYPVVFTGDCRKVELIGEAFFDVTKSDKPFVVKTADIDVRVLGTSFNLSGYAGDREVSVTLVEGKVAVREHLSRQECNIISGMRFEYNKETNRTKVEEVEPELYISWMKGKFKFEDMRLEDIMAKLNRWYDCTVTYTDDSLRDLRFTGAAEKDRSASYLLELIEMITEVKFEIDGKNIIIKHK